MVAQHAVMPRSRVRRRTDRACLRRAFRNWPVMGSTPGSKWGANMCVDRPRTAFNDADVGCIHLRPVRRGEHDVGVHPSLPGGLYRAKPETRR